MTEERLINIKDIEILEDMYPRSTHSIMTVEEYAEAMKRGAKFPPIAVAQSSTGVGKKYILIDGRHRIEAREMNNETHIQAIVHKNLSEKDIYIMAVELNSKHGVKLTRMDKLYRIIPKLNEFKVESAKISELVNISVSEVDSVRVKAWKTSKDEPEERTSMIAQRIGVPNTYNEVKIRGGSDITIKDAKGGVFLKAKEKTAAVLKEFVGRKMRMHVENRNIILQEAD